MANVVDWLLDLFYLGASKKKNKTKRTTLKKSLALKKVAKIKATAKEECDKNYVGRKPKK